MSVSTLTYDLSPPIRPAIADLGGGNKEQDAQALPDPVRHITKGDVDQWAKQIAAFARVVPNCLVTVHQVAGTYSVYSVSSLGTLITAPTFTVTKNGTGDVTLSWPAGTFPAPICDHEAQATGTTFALAMADSSTVNQVRVRIFDNANAAKESSFNAKIF